MQNRTKLRIGHLNTLKGVRAELGRCYRSARRGEIAIDELRAFTYCLRELRESVTVSSFEVRLERLENEVIKP